ncbi:MAG: Gfo/Idh/MocA family protein [Trueperaceae bacterium]
MNAVPTFALIGCGNRGAEAYGAWLARHPHRGRVVAVADGDPGRRVRAGDEHEVPAAARFADGAALLAASEAAGAPLADVAVVATPDRGHADLAVAALAQGYHLLLEKPIATSPDDIERVATAAAAATGTVAVAHVLRYAPLMRAVARVLREGRLGQLIHVLHEERIGAWHFAHSYVRGNWHREAASSPMLLAKACHDLDLLAWWVGAPATSVASTGRLAHFRPERAPAGATERCLDCPAAATCPYDAAHLYLDRLADVDGWPVSVVTADPSPEARRRALREGPYGRCVYLGANDVVDHQAVLLDFANGATATLEVNAFHAVGTRRLTLTGSHAELRGDLTAGVLEVIDHRSGAVAPVAVDGSDDDGHGGGDGALMDDLTRRLAAWKAGERAPSPTSVAEALASHRWAFAAERARRERRVVALDAAGRAIDD